MSLFPRSVYANQGFAPLFRLLEDFDTYQSGQSHCRGRDLPTFQPKFDVRETGDAYQLHGELAGMNKEDVQIEFSDPQTLIIRGRIERKYTSDEAPLAVETKTTGGSIEGNKAHQATVEDEDSEVDGTITPAESVATAKDAAPKDKAKYWLSERSIGEFARSFNFPTHVQQDAVTASLVDGILSVTVPKHKKTGTYRITVN